MNDSLALLLAVVLLVGNAFFVGAEFSILSARRASMEVRAREGDARATTALHAMEHVSLMLAACQVGVTVCSTGLGVVAEPALAHLLERPLHALGASPALAHPIALVIALAVVVFLHVVLGEMVPKNVAVAGPDRAVLLFAPPLVALARVLRPVIHALNWTANHALRLVGVEPRDEVASAFTMDEVQSIVEHSAAEGVLSDERGLLTNTLEFSARTAADVMVPLAELVTVDESCTPDDLERLVTQTGFSRFTVLDAAGEPVGYLHLKDVLDADALDREQPLPSWRVRALAAAEPGDEVEDVLGAMQRSGAHLALVRDAGRPVGVVFLEDILEELVGEVRDAMQRGTALRVARRR